MNKLQILEAMEHIRDHGPFKKDSGICANIGIFIQMHHGDPRGYPQAVDFVFVEAVGWEHHITPGRKNAFPVKRDPGDVNLLDVWDTNTQYGRDRWDLLNYLINKVK